MTAKDAYVFMNITEQGFLEERAILTNSSQPLLYRYT